MAATESESPHDRAYRRLEAMREASLAPAGVDANEKQHERGKRTARERVEALVDPGSFSELDRFAVHRTTEFGLGERSFLGDGVVTGHATIAGRRVFLFSQDFTVLGGSLGEVFAEKICKVMDLAVRTGSPMIGINDSGGARIQEGVVSLGGYAEICGRNVQASGGIPQIRLIAGPCAGGAISHATKSGVAHLTAADEDEMNEHCRRLLSFIPSNNLDDPPLVPSDDDPQRVAPELDELIPDAPNKPYDIADAIVAVVDDGDFFEIQ